MFKFIKRHNNIKELDTLVQKIEMNVANNYKDAAQLNLKEFEELLNSFDEAGDLSEKQKVYYGEKLTDFKGVCE